MGFGELLGSFKDELVKKSKKNRTRKSKGFKYV